MKLIGACLVMAGSMGLAATRIKKDRKRKELLKQLQNLFALLHSEIWYRNLTIAEAFLHISSRIDLYLSLFLQRIVREWKQKDGKLIREIWNDWVQTYFANSSLTKEDIIWISKLGEGLGSFDRTEQIRQIEYLTDYLKQEEELCEKKVRESEKMYRTMGVLIGIFIIVLLF